MKFSEFMAWLDGFSEASENKTPDDAQWELIKNKLKTVVVYDSIQFPIVTPMISTIINSPPLSPLHPSQTWCGHTTNPVIVGGMGMIMGISNSSHLSGVSSNGAH